MTGDRRFLVAMMLVLGVIIGTNMLFPPIPPEPTVTDSTVVVEPVPQTDPAPAITIPGTEPAPDPEGQSEGANAAESTNTGEGTNAPDADGSQQRVVERVPERSIVVEGPLYRYTFNNYGARLTSAELVQFPSFQREGGVELLPEGGEALFGNRVLVGRDTVDLRGVPFEVTPADGLRVDEGDPPAELRFRYVHPTQPMSFEVVYTFDPSGYVVGVAGTQTGLDRGLLITDLGSGIAFNEVKERDDIQMLAYVTNGDDGIRATRLEKVDESAVVDGPFDWVAFKSKYFVAAMLPGSNAVTDDRFGGILVQDSELEYQAPVAVTQAFQTDGSFEYRSYLGPQELARMAAVGQGLEDVNPYGWRFIQPIVRPVSGLITRLLIFFHERLNLAYGWVLILFGVLIRILIFPLHHRSTKAQLRNMEVQPKLKAIQTQYKDNPEQLQKEMMRLYKEEGFNPLAGCVPMLIPFPVLIALFFVFQNSIELRGESFWWLPDLSAPDPLYILPVFIGISMFLLQWIGFRSVPDQNPQMKMMMWLMPPFMLILFLNFPSGLNLYYATWNVAMLPQQHLIAKERMKAKEQSAKRSMAAEVASAPLTPEPAPAGAGDGKSANPGGRSASRRARNRKNAKRKKR